MKKIISRIIVGLSVVALVGLSIPSVSYSDTGTDAKAYALGSGIKLGRGIVNTATGWADVFRGIYEKTSEHDPVTGLVYGTLYGTGMAVVRTFSGVYEIATFLFPTPSKFKSTITPEFVWEDLE